MFRQKVSIFIFLIVFNVPSFSQSLPEAMISFTKKEEFTLPGKVLNISFFITNNSSETVLVKPEFITPQNWKLITRHEQQKLNPNEKKLLILTIQTSPGNEVGVFTIRGNLKNVTDNNLIGYDLFKIHILEVENISVQLIEKPMYVNAGELINATYLINNKGNTEKKVFIETNNCEVNGSPQITIQAGESANVLVSKLTSGDITESINESFSIRTRIGLRLLESISSNVIVFPSKKAKKDLFFRFPVKLSSTFLATNRHNDFNTAFQLQVEGSGSIDSFGKHKLDFLARGPGNAGLSFLGLHEQYYISYSNENIGLFAGDKSFSITPLTESSRYGRGAETKLKLNSGVDFSFLWVKPIFYGEIESEMAFSSGFNFKDKNNVRMYYISKKYSFDKKPVGIATITSELQPFKKTNIELEYSRGIEKKESSDAFRTVLNTQFFIFNLSGNYFYAGLNYPGYYNNSTFYFGNISARITANLNLGLYLKEDFINAQLDTFFVTAPYSRSVQSAVNYKIGSITNIKFYWRKYEKKDRLKFEKFHYETNSLNLQFNQHFKKIDYDMTGELGKTTNFLLSDDNNKQLSLRGSLNLYYRINSNHAFRAFGTWSNINQFVSGDQRNITAGFNISGRIAKNIRGNLYLQNAYDIDDYYKNRNLMQLNIDYKFLKKHTLSLRSFYTIFHQEVNNPEFTLALSYSYNLGIPLKQIIKAGVVSGRITNEKSEAVEGLLIRTADKTSITNSNGEFEFKMLVPGRHFLSIDRSGLGINELPDVQMPLQIDVFENETTEVNFKITKGAEIKGSITIDVTSPDENLNKTVKLDNIVVELKTNFEAYRITTDSEGKFSFPLVRPGDVTFLIYKNTLPKGFEAENTTYKYFLKADEKKEVRIELRQKRRTIILKTPVVPILKSNDNKEIKVVEGKNKSTASPQMYYSIQIGAFSKPLNRDAEFLKGEIFYFEKQIDNFYKYYIGNYKTLEEAKQAKKLLELKFRNAFIVIISDGQVLQLNEYRNR